MTGLSTSTEIAIPSTQLLCESIISQIGVDHSNDRGVHFNADWRVFRPEGEIRVHLHQVRGIGAKAIYLIRVENPSNSKWTDAYLFNCETGVTAQSADTSSTDSSTNAREATSYLEVSASHFQPLQDVNQLLFDGLLD